MIRIAISGICGRMGQALFDYASASSEFQVVFGVDTYPHPLSCPVFDSFEGCSLGVDVVVDFSTPSALDSILNYAEEAGARVVLATTGYSTEQLDRIGYASENTAIFISSNMSLGVTMLGQLVKDATRFLGDDYDIEIIETHHRNKIDAPSGTALTLAKEINIVKDNSLSYAFDRAKGKRGGNEIGFHSIRGGAVSGKHSVMFLGNGENITLSHEAESKDIFLCGALRAVEFILTKSSGLYGMKHLITHKKPLTSVICDGDFSILSIPSIREKNCATLFKNIQGCGLCLDSVQHNINNDGALHLSLCFKNCKNAVNMLVSDIPHRLQSNVGKIEILDVEDKTIIYDILSLMKSVGAKVHLFSLTHNALVLYIDGDKIAQGQYAIRSYFKL